MKFISIFARITRNIGGETAWHRGHKDMVVTYSQKLGSFTAKRSHHSHM